MLKGRSRRFTPSEFRKTVRAHNPRIRVLTDFRGMAVHVACKCTACKTEFQIQARYIFSGKEPCPNCRDWRTGQNSLEPHRDAYDLALFDKFEGIIIRLGVYQGALKSIDHKCNCGYIWSAAPNDMKRENRRGCPACGNGNRQYSGIAIKWLESQMQADGIFIQHMLNGGEVVIPGTRYRADGYCAETNTVYEFYGDVFHGNPKIFKSSDRPNYFRPEWTARDLQQRLKKKERTIRRLGFNLVTIWESEFRGRLSS